MRKTFIRGAAVTVGALLALAGVATPAAAEEIVPSGCVGSITYACTGPTQPPHAGYGYNQMLLEVPVAASIPGTPLVPGETVRGMQIGGYVVTVGGRLTEDRTILVGGPVGPVATGLTVPVTFCALVRCFQAGEPLIVPGIDLPVVPVTVPGVSTPPVSVPVPYVTTIQDLNTPPIGVPALDVNVTTVRVHYDRFDHIEFGFEVCRAGGGLGYWDSQANRYQCGGGSTREVANVVFLTAALV